MMDAWEAKHRDIVLRLMKYVNVPNDGRFQLDVLEAISRLGQERDFYREKVQEITKLCVTSSECEK